LIGQIISHYKIIGKLGAGGMGEVYRAEDQRLHRQVAVKALPDNFASNPERLARFEREAKLLAALSHPNIAGIYGLEVAEGKRFLILELVEGETLAQRLARGPLPTDEALDVCRQIAEGLETAHEKSIVHRDLKPSNIKLTPEGKVKILDFGLARAFLDKSPVEVIADSPTITAEMTQPGVILGTAAYMSPEQAKGKQVDKRADIWAFGSILFECLTGKAIFPGETITEVLAAVLKAEPDWEALPKDVPVNVRAVLRRCLQKDRNLRYHDIADVRIELTENADAAGQQPTHARRIPALPWLLAFLSTAGLIAVIVSIGLRHPTPSGSVRRFSIPIGTAKSLLATSLAISPDGTELAYTIDGRLFRRIMNDLAPVRLASVLQTANSCFFVNSEWVGCLNQGKLMKVILATGAPVVLCDAPSLYGAIGFAGDSIVFVPGAARGLWQVASQGGERKLLLRPDFAKGERSFRWPAALPDKRGLLFAMLTTENSSFDDARIMAYAPGGGDKSIVASGGTFPRFAPTGHVLFARSGNLHAIPFDPKSLSPTGPAKVVLEGLLMDPLDGGAGFDISEDGTLVYIPGGVISRNADIVWVDRSGNSDPILKSEPVDREIRVSPEGNRLAFNKGRDIWVYDLSLKNQVRITSDAAIDTNPVWSPDGRRIAFASNRAGDMDIYERSADGTGAETLLYASPLGVRPMSWSPDGKVLAFEDMGPTTGSDIKLLSFQGEGKMSVREFAATSFNERQASFSPDGRWIAYVSDESGEFEVYIQPSDGTPRRRKVSTNGGTEPLWNPKGGELIFFKGQTAFSVTVKTAPELVTSAPRELFKTSAMITNSRFRNVDISRDGSRIVMMVPLDDPRELEIRVVLNWFEELKRLVPIDKN
jgi:serine/threonine protein kinase